MVVTKILEEVRSGQETIRYGQARTTNWPASSPESFLPEVLLFSNNKSFF